MSHRSYNPGDIILIEVSGQYEFARVDYVRDDRTYLSLTTRSGHVMGGPFSEALGRTLTVDGTEYPLLVTTGFEPGYDDAAAHFAQD